MTNDPFRLDGLVALVTGASRGIGAGIAAALARAGANVACHGNSESPDATCEEVRRFGRAALPLRADLADKASSAKLIDATLAESAKIDLLVNNAGLTRRAPAVEFSEEDWAL